MPRPSAIEVEHVAKLARPIGDEQADGEEAAGLGQPVAEHGDQRRRVDVARPRARPRPARSRRTRPARSAASPTAPAPSTRSFVRSSAEDERLRDLLVRDLDDVVEDALEDRGRELAAVLHRDPVGDREARLADDADDAHAGPRSFSASAIPAASPPPPIGIDDRLGVRRLLRELEPDRPLAGDDPLVLERVDERRAGALDVRLRSRDRVLEALAGQLDDAAVRARRLDLRHRRVLAA